MSVVLGDDLVPRLSQATATDLREAMLCLYNPNAFGLSQAFSTAEVQLAADRAEHDRLAASHGVIHGVACTSPGRLFPAGWVVQIAEGEVREMDREILSELLVGPDMATSHMPHRYVAAIKEIAPMPSATSCEAERHFFDAEDSESEAKVEADEFMDAREYDIEDEAGWMLVGDGAEPELKRKRLSVSQDPSRVSVQAAQDVNSVRAHSTCEATDSEAPSPVEADSAL